MDILLKVRDENAGNLLGFLKSLPYVKVKELTPKNALFLRELKAAVENVNKAKAGKIKARPLQELLDGL